MVGYVRACVWPNEETSTFASTTVLSQNRMIAAHQTLTSRFAIAITLIAACLVAPCWLPADEIPHRSIRQPQAHPKDYRDWPRYTRRKSQLGWEYWSRHFCVTSTTNSAEAEWVAKDLEETWARIGRLADFWTDAHHQPTFCISAVGVMVTDRWTKSNGPTPGGPRTLNDEVALFVSISPGRPDLARQMPQVRREAVRSFIRVTQLDQILPEWVQTGMAEYVAEQQAGETPGAAAKPSPVQQAQMQVQEFRPEQTDEQVDSTAGQARSAIPAHQNVAEKSTNPLPSPLPSPLAGEGLVLKGNGASTLAFQNQLPVFLATVPQRTTEDTVPRVPTDPVASSAWIRFLLTGYDGQYSPLLLRALGETVAARGDDRQRWAAVSQGVWRPPIDPRLFREQWQPAELLVSRNAVTPRVLDDKWQRWRRDPLVGQPILEAGNITDPATLAAAGELIVLLKLAARFPAAPPDEPPKVSTFRKDLAPVDAKSTPPAAVLPIDLADLYARLTSDTTAPWSTIGPDGELIFWTDRERIDSLFNSAERQDRSVVRDGHQVLERNIGAGRQLAVWLEANPDNPQRPLARAAVSP